MHETFDTRMFSNVKLFTRETFGAFCPLLPTILMAYCRQTRPVMTQTFFQNTHNRHFISRPKARNMGCLGWLGQDDREQTNQSHHNFQWHWRILSNMCAVLPLFATITVGQRKKVTAQLPSSPRGRGRIKDAQIRAKYAKLPWMKSRDFWCIEWIRLDLSWMQTRYVDGTPMSEVTPVTIRYIRPSHHGQTSQYY